VFIDHPSPKAPFPAPVEYDRVSSGPNSPRPDGTEMGTEEFPVPVNRSDENDSPNPPTDPPPDGNEMTWPAFCLSSAITYPSQAR